MSSDTFVVTVLEAPTPSWQIWRVRNTTAGGPNDYVSTRSFALSALLGENSAAFSGVQQGFDEAWYRENVARFVETTQFLAECNHQPNDEWPDDLDFERGGLSARDYEDRLCERMHYVILSVEVVDPKHLEGLPSLFGTTAFDWWWRDPTRDPMPPFSETTLAALRPQLDGFIADGLEYLRSVGKA